MSNNIFAFTAPTLNYPEFISVNVKDGNLQVIVRGKMKDNGSCGETVEIKLDPTQARKLARTLFGLCCTTSGGLCNGR